MCDVYGEAWLVHTSSASWMFAGSKIELYGSHILFTFLDLS